ncbi:hypothetical protein QUB42_14530 [Microcoleus sp. Aus8_D1]|uniref:hypothetical protein n=2 Tax=unclassified Microcoleus TaxID=2642155 RepID=UPI002FD60A56
MRRSHFGQKWAIALPSILNCYNDNQPKNINAESMSTYSTVLTQVLKLSPDEQLRLMSELFAHIRQRVILSPKRSILELEALGKEIWNRIDAQEYVNQERDSWNR